MHRYKFETIGRLGGLFGLLLGLSLLRQGRAADVATSIGGVSLNIPVPAGFALVTPRMTNLNQVLNTRVSPGNECLDFFIPDSSVKAALAGTVPKLSRSLSVQTLKEMTAATISQPVFDGIKAAFRKQNAGAVEQLEQQIPGVMEALNQNVTNALASHPGLESLDTIPLPIHQETLSSLAFSSIANAGAGGANTISRRRVGVATATLVHLKGKILYVFAYGAGDDLDWTRKISADWVASILKANSSTSDSKAATH